MAFSSGVKLLGKCTERRFAESVRFVAAGRHGIIEVSSGIMLTLIRCPEPENGLKEEVVKA
jgi:hypothetical protein